MREILFLFAFLALFSSYAFSDSLTPGIYSFTSTVTEGITSTPFLSLSSKFLLTPTTETLFSVKIIDLSLTLHGEEATVEKFDLPFQFVRLPTGMIENVMFHPEDVRETKNFKKYLVEAFQASLAHRPHIAQETGFNGVRKVHYTVAFSDTKRIMVKGTYSLQDFLSFPALSNMEKSIIGLSSKKFTTFNTMDNSIVSSKIVSEIISIRDTKDVKFTTETLMQFESSEVKVPRSIEEVQWIPESLVHEVDPQARINTLKSQMPSASTLLEQALQKEEPAKALKANDKLVWLMNNDADALHEGLQAISENLNSDNEEKLYSTLARVSSSEAQEVLASEIKKSENEPAKLKTILKSLVALKEPANPSVLLSALRKIEAPAELQDQVDLTIGQISKFIPSEEASQILVTYVNRLLAAKEESEKVQLLYVLGNAAQNAPLDVILPFLSDPSTSLRVVALANLRNHLQLPKVQDYIITLLSKPENMNKEILNSFVGALKQNLKQYDPLNGKFATFLSSFVGQIPKGDIASTLQKLLAGSGFVPKTYPSAPLKSTSEVWNDTSDPLFDLVSPISQRNEDVLRYPENSAYLFAYQVGPRFVNLKVAGGVFSGSVGKGCVTGNFKIFDKLYTDTEVLGNVTVLADLQLYILNFGGKFDSRIYAIINGNTLLDFTLTNECSQQDIPVYDGSFDIVNYETEFPVGPANGVAFIQVAAGLKFSVGYKICLSILTPYVELFLTGEVSLSADAGVTITALGVVRGGAEANVFLNYLIGPDTQLGSRNNSAGELVCQACIGVYYGYQDQVVYTGLWFQRREGLSWGPKQQVPIFDYSYPAIPFPSPLIETCSETAYIPETQPKFLKQ